MPVAARAQASVGTQAFPFSDLAPPTLLTTCPRFRAKVAFGLETAGPELKISLVPDNGL